MKNYLQYFSDEGQALNVRRIKPKYILFPHLSTESHTPYESSGIVDLLINYVNQKDLNKNSQNNSSIVGNDNAGDRNNGRLSEPSSNRKSTYNKSAFINWYITNNQQGT